MRKSGYRVSNDNDSGGRKGPCKTCQFKRKVDRIASHFVMNRLDICRQRTTSLLVITPEKDTHAQNRELGLLPRMCACGSKKDSCSQEMASLAQVVLCVNHE